MPKYSIVTPMYNSFDLMDKYFDSLNRQKYQDFEVIIVDDCSSDDSYDRLMEYTKNSKLNITVCQTEKNAGPGNARNIGMDRASGEWLTFVDNDDWVSDDFFEKIENVLRSNDVHCVIYDYYIQKDNGQSVARSMYKGSNGSVTISECMIYVRNHTFGKFYKLADCKEKNVRFPDLRRCEDVAFVVRAIEACGSVYYLKEPLYYYYQRSTSLSNNKKLDESDMIKAFSILETELGDKYSQELKEKSVPDLLYGVLLMMCKAGKGNSELKDYICEYEKKYPEWWNCKILDSLGKAKNIFLIAARFKRISILKALAHIHGKLIS